MRIGYLLWLMTWIAGICGAGIGVEQCRMPETFLGLLVLTVPMFALIDETVTRFIEWAEARNCSWLWWVVVPPFLLGVIAFNLFLIDSVAATVATMRS